jgi:ribosomal protein S18 acetylase RimI-like enzyme
VTPDEITALRRAAEAPMLAGAKDLDQLVADFDAAFASDPIFDWFMRPDAAGRAAARPRFFRMLLTAVGLPSGQVLAPITGGAASIWIPSENLGSNPIWQELLLLPTLLATTGFARFSRMLTMRETMDRNHPTDRPHDYLWFLGVTPQAQGHGVGSRLLAAGLERVDARGRHAFLESSAERNVPLYRRHGFEVIREYQPGPGSPPIWAMWREARRG